MSAAKRLARALCLIALLGALAAPSARADFGIEPQSASAGAFNRDGSVDLAAGSHPYEYTVSFAMNHDSEEHPEGTLRDLVTELPPGMAGDPQATPRCSGAQFEGQAPHCPGNTQIGVAHIQLRGIKAVSPVYNLTPPLGVPASFGFSIANENSFQEVSLRSSDYGFDVSDITVPTDVEILSISETIWGVPADPAHDPQRECFNSEGAAILGCPTDTAPGPFLNLPTSCTGPLQTTIRVDSVQEPGAFKPVKIESLGEDGLPEGINDCEAPSFEPTISARPETAAADSPTGLHFALHVPQNLDPEGIATANLKDTTVTLPAGLAINPSTADGRQACSLAQIDLHGPGPAQCPPGSAVGSVVARSPALDHPVPGTAYIARQRENPFGSLIALYVVLDDPISGVIVKLAGEVHPDPLTGQLTTTFLDNPQLPVEDFTFDFSGGPRAALTTPATCATYTTTATLTPWTFPEGPTVLRSDAFAIASGAGGGPCPSSEAQMPNAPSFEAGTAAPLAGAFSPLLVRLSRENGSQRFGALNMTLPPGLSAKLAGVKECSEAQIAAAAARSRPGEGALEKASPSCPAASQIGTVDVGVGSGNPFFATGKIYLAGPYRGAPLSVAIIAPAVAGPFDLGTVVVRSPLFIDEETGQATVKSGPIPTILAGIPLDVRTIAVRIDRSDFALNPTSCAPKAVSGEEISTAGAVAPLKAHFQLLGCAGLGYSPKLSLSMKGSTRRSGHPALRTVLTQPAGQANSRKVSVVLPATEFIDQNHIANPCTRPQFAAGRCPPASVLGKAKVFTPLLDKPLQGKVYFRANGGERELPDVVVDLHGQVHVVLVGFTDAVHKKGSESSRVRTTFANLPDAPVSKAIIELNGGKKGLLVNSANICKVANLATVKMSAQNNKAHDSNEPIATSCGK
jgi:hypothetical protein